MDVTLDQIAKVVSEQLSGVESRLTQHVSEEIRKATEELKHQATVYKDELKHQVTLHKEDLRDQVKMSADGYGATLEKIERELRDLNQKVDTKFGDYDRILTNHHDRISTLESR